MTSPTVPGQILDTEMGEGYGSRSEVGAVLESLRRPPSTIMPTWHETTDLDGWTKAVTVARADLRPHVIHYKGASVRTEGWALYDAGVQVAAFRDRTSYLLRMRLLGWRVPETAV